MPRVYADGVLIAGDAGGFVNSMRLKGIHLAMRTGMLAAETAFDAGARRRRQRARCSPTSGASTRSDVRRALSGAQRPPGVRLWLAGRPAYSGFSLVSGGWWIRDPMPAHAGFERMQKLADYYRGRAPDPDSTVNPARIDPAAHVRPADQRALFGDAPPRGSAVASHRSRHRHLPHALPRGVRQSLHAVLSGERLRDGRRRRRQASGCRSTPRTACTARPATSWIRIRSSTGCRRKAAAGRTTKACSGVPCPWPPAQAQGRRDCRGRISAGRGARRDATLADRRAPSTTS